MQGTAADIIKLAMIQMDEYLTKHETEASMIMQVHDELVFEVAESKVESFKEKVFDIMTRCVDLHVPFMVHIGIGDNWDEAH